MGKKVKGRSFSWAMCGGPLAAKGTGERRATKIEMSPKQAGQRVPPPFGLPSGWTAEKHTYRSGKYQGKTYLRFASTDGKHTDICTVSQAIRKDAADKGYDPEPALQQCERRRLEQEAQRKQGGKDAEQGLGGDRRAVEAFRAKHGRLDRASVGHLPGWSLETHVLNGSTGQGQKATRYKGPGGVTLCMLKQVEAALGAHVLAGTDGELAAALEKARSFGQEEAPVLKAKRLRRKAGVRPARGRRTAKASRNAMNDGQKKKKKIVKGKIQKRRGR